MRRLERLCRVLPLIVIVAISGCQSRRPDFMTRVAQDCAAGDTWACDLIDELARPPPDEAASFDRPPATENLGVRR